MPTSSPETEAMLEHVKQGDSTHGEVPEASAVRMVRCLQTAYPKIRTYALTNHINHRRDPADAAGAASDATRIEEERRAQGSLLEYLSMLANGQEPSAELLRTVTTHSSIAGTVRIAQVIQGLADYSADNKQHVFAEMHRITSMAPGILIDTDGIDRGWDATRARWSTNRFYDRATSQETAYTTSPAEALNLVATALVDRACFAPSASGADADESFRVIVWVDRMLELWQERQTGQLRRCSTGIQHEILFLLNGIFLVDGHPIDLPVSTSTFSLDKLSEYIRLELAKLSETERMTLILTWLKQQNGVSTDDKSPITEYLRTLHPTETTVSDKDAAWKRHCTHHLTEQFASYGLNPATCKGRIDATIQALEDMAIPGDGRVSLLGQLMRTNPLPEPPATTFMRPLIVSANAVLDQLKSITADKCPSHDAIKIFFTASQLLLSLNEFRSVSAFSGADEESTVFDRSRHTLTQALLDYFQDFHWDKRLPDNFDAIKQNFLTRLHTFKKSQHAEFIKNFFILLTHGGDWKQPIWDQMLALQTSSASTHPLTLDEETLERWYREYSDATAGSITLSTYEINRILLQAILVPPIAWRPHLKQALQLVSTWLMQPETDTDAPSIRALKRAYPPGFLSNVKALLIVLASPDVSQAVKDECSKHVQDDPIHMVKLRTKDRMPLFLTMMLRVPPAQRSEIWAAVHEQLNVLIRDGHSLACLMELPELTDAQHNEIWAVFHERLGTLIRDGHSLARLLALPKLTIAQHNEIWAAVHERLNGLIHNADVLIRLLGLPQLTIAQHHEIWAAVHRRLGGFIHNVDTLIRLLTLPKLTDAQRDEIWATVREQLGELIKNKDALIKLLELSTLTEDQCNMVLSAVHQQMSGLIRYGHTLVKLMKLSLLTEDQRDGILTALSKQLNVLISNGDILEQLLRLPQLTSTQRDKIMAAVHDRLGMLIRDGRTLARLMGLSYLTDTQRNDIWAAVRERLEMLIRDGGALACLMGLSSLTDTQRNDIWAAAHDRLGVLIPDGTVLVYLLRLPQLTDVQRNEVLAAVHERLGALISNGLILAYLMGLPHLTDAQRNEIWLAARERLGVLLRDGDTYARLMELPHLNSIQRDEIKAAAAHLPSSTKEPEQVNLHEALVIFRLDPNYTQREVDQAYDALCRKVSPRWREKLDEGKRALEVALRSSAASPSATDGAANPGGGGGEGAAADPVTDPAAALTLARLRHGIYPLPVQQGFKSSSRPYDRLTPLMFPTFQEGTPIEKFSSSLIPLLWEINEQFSFDNPGVVPPRTTGRLTVVLDLDETLISTKQGPIEVRPYARAFLDALSKIEGPDGEPAIEVAVYSSGERMHVDACRTLLDPKNKIIKHSICRGESWVKAPPALKDLSLLSADFEDPLAPTWGGRKDTILLIDDSPYATVNNGHISLLIPDFQPEHPNGAGDSTLLYVLQVVARASHILSYHASHAPVAYPEPGFGRKYILEAPAFRAALSAIEAKKSVPEAAACASAAALAFAKARNAAISAQLAATKTKIEAHMQLDGKFSAEAIEILLQDRIFVAAVEAIRTGKPLPEAVKYIVKIIREVGKLSAADLAADHPFMVVAPVSTVGGELQCLRLDIAKQELVTAKIKQFRAAREKSVNKHTAEMTPEGKHPIVIHAAQVHSTQLLETLRAAEAYWVAATAGAAAAAPAAPVVTAPIPPALSFFAAPAATSNPDAAAVAMRSRSA